MPYIGSGPLTPRQTEIVAMLAGGLNQKRIAERLGIAPSVVTEQVTAIAKKGALPPGVKQRKPYRGNRERVLEMLLNRIQPSEIARRLGVLPATVYFHRYKLRAAGLIAPRFGRPPGVKNETGDSETRREARERVAADIASGARCPRCHLILPHDDCAGWR